MINLDFEERLKLLDLNNKVLCSSDQVTLEEIINDGKAKLLCNLKEYSIVFIKADDNILPYFKDKKCADVIIFQKGNNELWKLIIIEFKKTMSIKNLIKSMQQFKGAINFAIALAGLLDVKFDEIEIYSAFREDKISKLSNENLNILKTSGNRILLEQWESEIVKFDFVDKNITYGKITLNSEGEGTALI